jgi:prepilin-type processing-associated H-X9-DG protein
MAAGLDPTILVAWNAVRDLVDDGDWAKAFEDIKMDSLVVPGYECTAYRLREGIERFFITDINNPAASATAQSGVWVMWDILSTDPSKFSHIPGGSNVLFMDGHVEFIKFPGEMPVTRLIAVANG